MSSCKVRAKARADAAATIARERRQQERRDEELQAALQNQTKVRGMLSTQVRVRSCRVFC
jgi:hypothetical protein